MSEDHKRGDRLRNFAHYLPVHAVRRLSLVHIQKIIGMHVNLILSGKGLHLGD